MATPTPSKWQPGQLLFVGFNGTTLPYDLRRLIGQGRVGGVILFTRNLPCVGGAEEGPQDVEAARRLIRSIHAAAPRDLPVAIAVDQEGGRVQRLREPWTRWPAMRHLGDVADDNKTRGVATALATELADMGITLDFAPVVDVDTNPDNPVIGDRSFGRTPQIVSRHATIMIQAMQAAGVATCAKHFPGHGDTVSDSHLQLPRLPHDLDRLRAVELPPFRAAIEAGVASVMTAHVVFEAIDPKRPATLAPEVMHVLRDELGYDGLVFTDDLEMKAVADHYSPQQIVQGALESDVDSMLVCRSTSLRDEVLSRLERAPDAAVERAVQRMVRFKETYASAPAARALGDEVGGPPYGEHQALAASLKD